MEKSTKRYLASTILGTVGCLTALGGFKVAKDGIEELDDTLFDFTADKVDMYEASGRAVGKTLAGLGLVTLGGMAVGGSLGTAYLAGQESILEQCQSYPVEIMANSLEEAQKNLDALKILASENK